MRHIQAISPIGGHSVGIRRAADSCRCRHGICAATAACEPEHLASISAARHEHRAIRACSHAVWARTEQIRNLLVDIADDGGAGAGPIEGQRGTIGEPRAGACESALVDALGFSVRGTVRRVNAHACTQLETVDPGCSARHPRVAHDVSGVAYL